MTLLRNALAELVGLFVDDWLFVILTLAWIGLFALPGVRSHGTVAGLLLFGGLAALVLGFVARKAR